MTQNMKTIALVVATMTVGSAAFAQTQIGSVGVSVDLDAIENERAAQYWNDIADDLETALVTRLVDQTVEDGGASLSVDINELSLATAFQEDFGIEDTTLVGQVSVLNLQDQSEREFYELTISYDQTASFISTADGGVVSVSMSDKEYYNSMIDAFADNVVAKLQ